MAAHSIKAVQKIPVSLEVAWEFFSNPANLQKITPPGMGFKVVSRHHGNIMYAGQIIEYRLKPLLGVPVYWMTEITRIKDNEYFIDEQRSGPYRLWHHQHHFTSLDGGVEMRDIVHYRIPLWLTGGLANWMVVKRQLKNIFLYRFKKVEEIFGKWPGGQEPTIEMI